RDAEGLHPQEEARARVLRIDGSREPGGQRDCGCARVRVYAPRALRGALSADLRHPAVDEPEGAPGPPQRQLARALRDRLRACAVLPSCWQTGAAPVVARERLR